MSPDFFAAILAAALPVLLCQDVPNPLARRLYEPYLVVVVSSDNLGRPMLVELSELLGQIYFRRVLGRPHRGITPELV